ncbi:MAG: recombinase family protein [Clostridia bacterium]|nr:recombinase family protein [Clostridia bacterium]
MKSTLRKIVIGLLFGGYVDEGISGTTSKKRENFMRMIEDGSNKKFDLLITKEVSRFSRDTIDSLLYTRKLLEYDVCVYFLSDNIITASSDGELRLTIMSSMAQDEVRKISERTKFGFKRALEKGTVLGTDNIWGYKKKKGKLVIDEEEAHCIRETFDIYANDSKIGLKKLSKLLKEQGYCNHNGNPIHPNTLKRIIQNPKYKGYYTGGLSTVVDYRSKKRNFNDQAEWKVYKDYEKVPPIVSEELWEKANQKLLARSKKAAMYQKHQTLYALSGKLYCDKHKCGFVRKIRHYKNKGDVIYWYCADFHKTGKKNCILACFKEDDLYDILLSIFKSYEIYKEEICEELLSFYKELSKEEENIEQEVKLQNELEVLERKKDKLLDLTLDGLLNKEDLGNKKVIIETEISKIQAKLKELECKKKTLKEEKYQDTKLKESMLKQLVITKDNLENYIEELLDKIIVVEKTSPDKKEQKKVKSKSNREKGINKLNEKESEVELKIILTGNKIITYGSATKLRQFSQLKQNKVADFKKVPLCHSHAHSNHLFT